VKCLLWLATLAFAAVLSACGGGGGSNIPPPPPAGGFTLSSLKGQYAFSMSGLDQSAAYFARTGSFIADGAGNISSGMEDVVDLSSTAPITQIPSLTGKYTVLANGRGTIALTDGSSPPMTWAMELQSSSQGFVAQTDGNVSSSGSFNLQTTTDFVPTALNGNYVFDFAGESLTGATPTVVSTIGNITATGNGIITGGVSDTNDGNTGPSGASTIAQTSYTLDPANGTTFGRGTLQFATGYTFAFYIVDATRIKFIEEDSYGGSSGDGVLQSGAIPTTTAGFTGSFVYQVGGSSTTGPDAAVARFTANADSLNAISYDQNNDGTPRHISQGTNISNASYTIDTANPGSGRGTFTFTDSSSGLTFQYVFYLTTPASGVIQTSTSGFVEDGTLLAQTGSPFTLAGLAGNYAFSWSGVDVSSLDVENYVGQYALASSASNDISGVLDGAIFGNTFASYANIGTQGTLTVTADGTNNNAYQIVAGNPLGTTYNFQAYIVDANTVLLVSTSTDKSRVLAGFVSRQSQ
jgi:hypothetical protein